jgi:hypothetical protein
MPFALACGLLSFFLGQSLPCFLFVPSLPSAVKLLGSRGANRRTGISSGWRSARTRDGRQRRCCKEAFACVRLGRMRARQELVCQRPLCALRGRQSRRHRGVALRQLPLPHFSGGAGPSQRQRVPYSRRMTLTSEWAVRCDAVPCLDALRKRKPKRVCENMRRTECAKSARQMDHAARNDSARNGVW